MLADVVQTVASASLPSSGTIFTAPSTGVYRTTTYVACTGSANTVTLTLNWTDAFTGGPGADGEGSQTCGSSGFGNPYTGVHNIASGGTLTYILSKSGTVVNGNFHIIVEGPF